MFRPTQSSIYDRKSVGGRRADGLVDHPPSPPDTESISSHLGSYATPQRRPSQAENFLPAMPAVVDIQESAGARYRRLAGIPTTQSFSREFRGASRPQTRWLLVLLPPENLVDELSVGHRSPGKLKSGLLVPLFPTLFAQLSAIAKEFNLPSTTGLCLYLHIPDTPDTPLITDEIWPILFSRHLHSSDESLPLGLPVAGRVQFDIDVSSARWYPMWFAHVSRKELVPNLARAIPTSPRSPRGGTSTQADAVRAQKVPRPLALVPRQESLPDVQIDSGSSPVPSPSKAPAPPTASKETVEKVRRWSALVTPEPATLQPSPPKDSDALPAEDSTEPATGSEAIEAEIEPEPLNLEDFQWSITSAGPSSPASSCATTASSHVPSIHLLERAEGSVILTPTTATSWGPQYDSDVESELDPEPEWRVRSPDVGERAEGSVLLTPSTATSWGAPLSYPPTPAQWSAMHELVRSPDLGERAEGSVLLTPSTATTWGAPLSYPPTPAEWRALVDHIVRSPDLGRRAEGSVLLTPSTATTWGPPSAYPDTPEFARSREWVPSPGLGDREELTPGRIGRMSVMNWGTEIETEEEAYARMGLVVSGGAILPGVPEEADEEYDEEHDEDEVESSYEQESLDDLHHASVQQAVRSVRDSVLVQVTQEVHYDDTRSVAGSNDDVESLYDGHTFGQGDEPERAFEFELELESPQLGVVTEEHHDATVVESSYIQEVHASRGLIVEDYDFENEATHGPVEIDFGEGLELAPEDASVASDDHDSAASIEGDVFEYAFADSRAEPAFPVSVSASEFPLSPAVDFDSPVVHSFVSETPAEVVAVTTTITTTAITTSSTAKSIVSTRSYGAYPYLVIYPAVYPHLDLYPRAPAANSSRPTLGLSTRSRHSPASSIANSPVDSVRSPASSRKSSLSIHIPTNRGRSRSIVAVNPADKRSVDWSRSLPPVPPVPRAFRDSSIGSIGSFSRKGSGSSLGSVKEVHAEEAVVTEGRERTEAEPSVPSRNIQLQPSSTAYPYRYPENLEHLYPSKNAAHYPTSLGHIYPILDKKVQLQAASPVATRSVGAKPSTSNNSLATYSSQAYPLFNLYPAVYPHNLGEIYPALPFDTFIPTTQTPKTAPVLSVPPQVPSPEKLTLKRVQDVTVSRGYPFIDLYPAVYPHNLTCLYPSVRKEETLPRAIPVQATQGQTLAVPRVLTLKRAQNVRVSRGYPFIDLYPAVYPHNLTCLYPSTLKEDKLHRSISAQPAQGQALATPRVTRAAPSPSSALDGYPFNLDNIYPAISCPVSRTPIPGAAASSPVPPLAPVPKIETLVTGSVRLAREYPNLELYRPVYPYNLVIYPSIGITKEQKETQVVRDKVIGSTRLAREYPNLELYKPVYPYNLVIYPPVGPPSKPKAAHVVQDKIVGNSPVSDEYLGNARTDVLPKKTRKSHAQLCTEAWRKTHAQLVAEVLASRSRKSHAKLELEVFPNGLPEAKVVSEVEPATPTLSITEARSEEPVPLARPALEKLAPVAPPNPGPKSAPVPAVAALRRQRSGTIMRASPTESLATPPFCESPTSELGRSRSMVEARAQMFERTHTRSQTAGPQGPPARTLIRQKSATFERAQSLFHTEEAKSEGSQTPPQRSVPMRRVTKLDMSKFGFA